jgi:hypothetical protein
MFGAPRLFSLLSAVIVAVGLILSAIFIGSAVTKSREADDTIRVNGTARRIIHSDYIIWDATVSNQADTVAQAYNELEKSSVMLHHYLIAKGISSSDIFPLAIATETLFEKSGANDNGGDQTIFRKIKGYKLSQTIEIRSSNVQLVEEVSRSSTDLIKQGIGLDSQSPQYLITKLSELKDSLLAEAAANAKIRAEKIALSSGAKLGNLQYSHMGVMSVTGAYDDEDHNNQTSGKEDTEAIDKRITVLVTSAYKIK